MFLISDGQARNLISDHVGSSLRLHLRVRFSTSREKYQKETSRARRMLHTRMCSRRLEQDSPKLEPVLPRPKLKTSEIRRTSLKLVDHRSFCRAVLLQFSSNVFGRKALDIR